MTTKEVNQYLLDNQNEIINTIASTFESGINDETLEMADIAHTKMIDLLEERFDEEDEFELSEIDNLAFDAQKELGFFVKSNNSIADMMAADLESRDEFYNPLTKSFEKY